MHFHLPKPLHGWREFVGEVGVIVLGILIALGLEQAIEGRNEREKAETAHRAIENEIHAGLVDARLDNAMIDCSRTQLAALSDAVGKSDMSRARQLWAAAGLPGPHVFSDAAWQSALASGITADFSTEDQLSFPGLYAILRASSGYQFDYFKAEARLESLLMSGLSKSPVAATQAVSEFAQINASLEDMQVSLQAYQQYADELGFKFSRADDEQYRTAPSQRRIAKCKASAAALAPIQEGGRK